MNNEQIRIEYDRPPFQQVCFCKILDFILSVLLCLSLFLGIREIVKLDSYYKETEEKYTTLKLDSCLYKQEDNKITDIVSYYMNQEEMSYKDIENGIVSDINNFYTFLENKIDNENYTDALQIYKDFLLSADLVYNDKPYFVVDGDNIIKNPNLSLRNEDYVNNVYYEFVDNYAQGIFNTKLVEVIEYQKYFSNMLIYVEIPISSFLGLTIYFYVIPLFFKGKKTIGKLLFKIGLVDSELLDPKIGQFTLNFVIFFVLECVLSIVSFCIPLIISFSMEVFSKKKQNFHNYLTNFQLVMCDNHKIYGSKDEILIEKSKESERMKF